jgi:hypothetical protein
LVCDIIERAFLLTESLSANEFLILVETNNIEVSDLGSDWVPCISSILQIISSRKHRTIDGILEIIEREWVQSGHDFVSRGLDYRFKIQIFEPVNCFT